MLAVVPARLILVAQFPATWIPSHVLVLARGLDCVDGAHSLRTCTYPLS